MAAPKPRPVALKLVEGRGHGRDSGGRKVAVPPAFKRLPPVAPEWLMGEALAEWGRVVPELARLDLTKTLDAASLTAYCLCWARLVEGQRLIDAEGLLGRNSQGVVRHPAVAVVEAASKELRAWAGEFGLTPSSESRMKAQGGSDDEDDAFS